MNILFTITKDMKAKAEKLNKFTTTYLRCFQPIDTKRILNRHHTGKFVSSFLLGPGSFLASYNLPFNLVYSEFYSLPLIYEFPVYLIAFMASREIFGHMALRADLRFKQRIYEKYQPQMDLTKDDIEELEYEEQMRLKIEQEKSDASKENSKENSKN